MLLFLSLDLQEVLQLPFLMEYLPKACCCPGGCDEGPDRRKRSGRESGEVLAPVTCSIITLSLYPGSDVLSVSTTENELSQPLLPALFVGHPVCTPYLKCGSKHRINLCSSVSLCWCLDRQ